MAAIRSLDRARHNRAAFMLAESRERLNLVTSLNSASAIDDSGYQPSNGGDPMMKTETSRRQSTHAPPPPIAEVLRDLYEEEKKTA
jgi:hypothetical protein